ncbi:MAG: ATP-binding cassette domain-containing protein, partial [Planctomycetes bacterium]|nr:ATP-binding cassette domain-containing protein [Planctomycetota bacterium]
DPVRRSRDVLRRIGYVPDVPDAPLWLCARDLFLVLSPHYPTWNNRLASELCERLVVPMHTPLAALSRGQGMKVMLVAALAPEPELLLLDEPFAGLDPLVREQVLEVVIDSVRAGERTVLCATHELELAARIADRIAVLEGGRIVQHGTLDEVLGEPEPAQVPQGLQRVLATAAQAVLA